MLLLAPCGRCAAIIDALCTLIHVTIPSDNNDNDNDNDNKHSKVTYPPQECLWP